MWRVTTTLGGPMIQGGGSSEMYLEGGVGFSAADAHAAVVAFWTALSSVILSTTTGVVESVVEEVDEVTGDVGGVTATTTSTLTFTRTGAVMPPQNQGLVQWRTGTYSDGREIRGRTFIPALTQDLGSGGVPTATLNTAITNAATAYLSPATSAPVIWRRPRPARPQIGNPGDRYYLPAQTARPGMRAFISSGSPWGKFAVLRSRRD